MLTFMLRGTRCRCYATGWGGVGNINVHVNVHGTSHFASQFEYSTVVTGFHSLENAAICLDVVLAT